MIQGCAAYLTIQGTKVNNSASVWEHDAKREYDIGNRMGLFLFTVHKNDKEIGFPAADEHKGFIYNFLPYEGTLNKELIIDFQSKTGNVPKTITKKISDIITEGDKEKYQELVKEEKYQWIFEELAYLVYHYTKEK